MRAVVLAAPRAVGVGADPRAGVAHIFVAHPAFRRVAMCHRNAAEGWVRDKYVRDAGPWIGTYANGAWSGQYYGTHSPVLIWYSREMVAWLKENRPDRSEES